MNRRKLSLILTLILGRLQAKLYHVIKMYSIFWTCIANFSQIRFLETGLLKMITDALNNFAPTM